MLAIITIFSTFALNKGGYPGNVAKKPSRGLSLNQPSLKNPTSRAVEDSGGAPGQGRGLPSRLEGPAPRPSRAAGRAPSALSHPLSFQRCPPAPSFLQPLYGARARGSGDWSRAGSRVSTLLASLSQPAPHGLGSFRCPTVCRFASEGRRAVLQGGALGGSIRPVPSSRPPRSPSPLGILGCQMEGK